MEQVDDILAQSCQVTLSLALAVGLLDNSTEGFAVSSKPNTYYLKHEHLSLSNVNWARLPFNVISTSHGSFSSRAFQNAPFGGMLIVCLAANLGIGGGTIVFEFLKVFFPKQVDFIVMTTTRRWGQLLGQPVQRSSKVVVPFLDTSTTTIVVGGTPGVQTPMPWPLSLPALTNCSFSSLSCVSPLFLSPLRSSTSRYSPSFSPCPTRRFHF